MKFPSVYAVLSAYLGLTIGIITSFIAIMIIYKTRYDHGPDRNPPLIPIMSDRIRGAVWVMSMPVNAKTHMITMIPEIPWPCN